MDLDAWKKRYTVRRFDTNFIPEKQQIKKIVDLVEYIPIQLGQIDHAWTVLGPNDAELKQWLVDNVYNTYDHNQGHREYFTMLADAPYVFHSFRITWDPSITRVNKMSEVIRNNSFHAGVIVCEALDLGLDVAQICCTDGIVDNGMLKKDIFDRYIEIMRNRHRSIVDKMPISPDRYSLAQPLISIAVGKGLPNTEQNYTSYKDGVTHTGQKPSKPFNNCVDLSDAN